MLPVKLICLFIGNDLMIATFSNGATRIPRDGEMPLNYLRASEPHIFMVDRYDVYVMHCDKLPSRLPPGLSLSPLRPLFATMDALEFTIACKASQIAYWDDHSVHCPKCGAPTERFTTLGKRCTQCNFEIFPSIHPAIIVRIERGDEILLVRAHSFRGDHYGLVAGFVEPGESLEECVRREVMEETGLTVSDIQYYGSQSWPFPSGIMVGFTARYVSGEIRLQREELADAAFFRADNLPTLPDRMSIARHLIDDWLEQHSNTNS